MLTQAQADRLIAITKEAQRADQLSWETNKAENELLIAVEERELHRPHAQAQSVRDTASSENQKSGHWLGAIR